MRTFAGKWCAVPLLVWSTAIFGQSVGIHDQLSDLASELDGRSVKDFDVHIADLAVLFESKAKVYALAMSMDGNKMKSISALESKGLIVVNRLQSAQGELIELIPTERGKEIILLFRKLAAH